MKYSAVTCGFVASCVVAGSLLTCNLACAFETRERPELEPVLGTAPSSKSVGKPVGAVAQSIPMATQGDAADDPAVWLNAANPEKSLIIGTNKKVGLVVYDLDGKVVQDLPIGRPNNVDVISGVATPSWGKPTTDFVVASNRSGDVVNVFTVRTGESSKLHSIGQIPVGLFEVYGICGFVDPATNALHIAVNNKGGTVRIFALSFTKPDEFVHELKREFHVGTQIEGMVADVANNCLYVGEELVGVWKYALKVEEDVPERTLLDIVHDSSRTTSGKLARDVEGVTLYEVSDKEGYVLVSCQAEDRYAVYDRVTGMYVGSFKLTADAAQPLADPVTHTDGIAAFSLPLGSRYPSGLFVAQDDNDGIGQNFKIVDWRDIAASFNPPLRVRVLPTSRASVPGE